MFSIFHESLLEQTEDDSDASSSTAVGHESTNDTYQSFNRENQPDIQSLSHSISTSTSEFHSKRVARSCSIFDDSESECDDDDSGRAPSNFSPLLENQNIDFSSIAPLLQNLNVVQCRELIDKISNHCTSNFLRVVKEASSAVPNGEAYAEKFKNRVSNLYNQHDEYEKFVSSIKTQLTESKTQNEFYNVGVVIEKFLKEFKLFQQFLPAYGFREKILEEIKKSQVTIISADYSYFLNVALPIILSNTYQNHTVIACEANEILSHVLQRKINYLLSNKNLPSHDSPLCVLSENQLLERFSYTTLFSGSNSCVILNSSVKRSVTGDIILSNLRDLLTTQTNSKLVLLLSPYDNTAKYVDYFLAKKLVVSKLNLPSILLPVKTVWKTGLSSPGENYQDDLVRTIISIHAVSEPGDIVTFLPSDEDVRSLSEELDIKIHNYQYSDLKIACIYDEDLYSFVKSEKGRALERKVFLFVNNYEGLIIPSVRYIIDSGIQKESMYDSKSGVDVVAPTFVSQTRAKVRKYLAGMHNAGICFRLYSKTNYLKNMRNKEYSELFTGNPLHSIVKIFQHCPQKVKSLPNDGEILFVESLPNDVLINNVKLLKSYGAIDNNSCLTPFGEKMVKLPLPTKYTKLILYGLQYGFAFEAVVLVAFFSVKSAVFVDSVDEAHQKSIDAVKLHFNQQNSDTLMWLNIFKQWKVHRFRQSFCTKYHINHATLTNVRRKVNEIIHLVQEFLDQEVIQQFSESNDFSLVIQMLFECFNENLCTYSGHHRVGYKVLGNQQFALIHPSSVLSLIGDLPVYVIYEDIVVSDQRYIRNLTSIPFDDVMKYREEGILSYNDDVLFDDKLVERAIDGVGEKIVSEVLLKNSGRKAREFEEIVKNKTGTEVVIIDPVLERGSIRVYAFPEFIDRCVRSLNDLLQNYIQALTNEEETKVIELRKGQNRVLFEMTMAKGAKVLSIQRALANLQKPSPNSASSSVASMSELSQTSSSINYSLKVVWPRRVCTGDAYVNFKNPEAFLCARRKVNSYITIGDFEALLQISNMQLNQLLLTYLPPKVTKEDISNYFNQLLSAQCLPSEFEVQLCRLGPFETSVKKLSEMKQQIEQNCKIYTNMRNIEVKVIKPEPSADYMTAYVNLFEKRCLNTEARNLSATKVNNMRLSCEPLYFSDLECSVQVYNALKFQINAELQIFSEKIKSKGDKYSLKAHIHKDTVAIKLSSHDLEIMTSLQVLINDLLNGVKLDKTNLRDIHKLFCHGGHIFLKTLEQTLKVFIMENYETKTIRLFGLKEDCNYIRQYICNFLEDTESEIVKNIILSDERQNRVLLKAVIAQYGANLEKFIEVCGLRSAALNIKTSCLSLYGRKENVEEAEKCIKELSATTGFSDVCSDESSEEMCPVCTCPVENLAFRLQHCGHLYCLGELRALITKGDFPIQCCASNCEKDIILEDIKYVLNNDPAEIDDLANKAFKAYLDKNKDKIFYCCAPDCSMFMYKKDIKQDKWNCPLCKNCICIKCNVVYHEGYTCDMYQGSRGDPDYSFKVWQKENPRNRKRCPKCKMAIEKRDGCNHMTCYLCSCHFCWICDQYFPDGQAVYTHIARAHAGQLFAP